MAFYKCGHERGIVILDDSPLCFAAYLAWKDTKGFDGDKSLCWPCWCKEHNKQADGEVVNDGKKCVDNCGK
jgi:hypothetical protein